MDAFAVLSLADLLNVVAADDGSVKTTFLLNHGYSFFYGLAAFLIFSFIIVKFGLKPIVTAIDARDKRIAEQMAESEETAKKAKELQAQLEKELAGAEAKIADMMAEARRDAEAVKAKLVEDGQAEVENLRQKALRDIDAARYQAIVDLRNEVAEVSTTVAEKVLRQELDASRHRQLVSEAIDAFEQKAG